MKNVAIIGDGAMGTLCALLLTARGLRVRMWSRSEARSRELANTRENQRYLPGFALPETVGFTTDPRQACDGAELAVAAVPCQFLRPVLDGMQAQIPAGLPFLSVAKGIEIGTSLCPCQIIADVLGERPVAALSGPCIAGEVAGGHPTAVVVASHDPLLAKTVQGAFGSERFRVYTNSDLVGVELAGAFKNVIALAAGMLDGMNAGANSKATLLTRGLVEMSRLGEAMGAKAATFTGLAGLGDLFTTAVSPHSRNRTAGEHIGRGETLAQAAHSLSGVVEGVGTTQAVIKLAQERNVELPIANAVHAVLFEGLSCPDAVRRLMLRDPKAE